MDYWNKLYRIEKKENGVAVVTLDNPPVNTITLAVTEEQIDIFLKLERDQNVRVIVLTGAGGKAFCAGSDIREFPTVRDDVIYKKLKRENEAYNLLEQIQKPVVAALEGIAYGGGAELALCCDIRIAASSVKIAFPEINLGVVPGTGGVFRLPKAVGVARALEMMYTGLPVTAQKAMEIGLVNQVVPEGTALKAAVELAGVIAGKPAKSLATLKQKVREMYVQSLDACFWSNLKMSDPLFRSAECEEGANAFLEKRKAKFH